MMHKEGISIALSLYLGYGKEIHPGSYNNRVIHEFGDKIGSELLVKIDEILSEVEKINIDWSLYDLSSAANYVSGFISERYPCLDGTARNAIRWAFTWWNR